MEGKAANKVKGSPRPSPNPSIAIVIGTGPSFNEPANTEPNNGPVQEKDTIASTKAIKMTPINPPKSAALSALEGLIRKSQRKRTQTQGK